MGRPGAPTSFTGVGYTGVPTEDLQALAKWAHQLPSPPDVVHINVVDATLLAKGWTYRVNNKLRSQHPSLSAIRFSLSGGICARFVPAGHRKARYFRLTIWVGDR